MDIKKEFPPRLRARKKDYSPLISAALEANGAWLSVACEDITGDCAGEKQSRIHAAAKRRGCKVQTTVADGRIYVRLLSRTGDTDVHTR